MILSCKLPFILSVDNALPSSPDITLTTTKLKKCDKVKCKITVENCNDDKVCVGCSSIVMYFILICLLL